MLLNLFILDKPLISKIMKRIIVFLVLIYCAYTASAVSVLNVGRHEKGFVENDKNRTENNNFRKHLPENLVLPKLRSESAVKLRYDSLVNWELDDTGKNFIYDYKYTFKFNNSGKVNEYYYYSWDLNESSWICLEFQAYTHDVDGNVIQTISYYYNDSLQVLLPDFKKDYTYNNGQKLSYTLSYWSEIDKSWGKTWKDDFSYDANGKNTGYVEYKWNNTSSVWQNYWKQLNTYDSNGKEINSIEYFWDKNSSNWYEYSKTETTYDIYGNLSLEIDYDWNDSLRMVVPVYRNYYYTDNLKYSIIDYESVWNLKTSEWDMDWKGEYSFDTKWNPTLEMYYSYDADDRSFYNYSRYEYLYDASYNLADVYKSPFSTPYPDFGEKVVSLPLENKIFSYNDETKIFDLTKKGLYYYSNFNVNNNFNPDIRKVRVFPNPVSNQLIVTVPGNSTQFDLFDIQGRKILSETLNSSGIIYMSDLSKGIYFYKVYVDGVPETGKLIKE
jgi:hypothetical protein